MNYEVYDRSDRLMLQSDCRYDSKTEKEIIQAGYTIKLNGRKVK